MKPIIIQGAMDVELSHLRQQITINTEETLGGYQYYHGIFHDYPIILSKTQIGMVHCAAATTIAITKYNPALLLNQGLAGAHNPNLTVGDIVVGEQVRAINSFEKPLAKEGIHYEFWLDTNFYSDDRLIPGHPPLITLFDNAECSGGKKIRGVLGSGDVWNREWDFIRWLHKNMNTQCEDMETQAMCKVAGQFAVPALGLRIISNNELREEAYRPETAQTLQDFILSQLPNCIQIAKEEPSS